MTTRAVFERHEMTTGIGFLDTSRCLSHDRVDRRSRILPVIVSERPDDIAPVLEAISEISAEIPSLCCSLICKIRDIWVIETIFAGYAQKHRYAVSLGNIENTIDMRKVSLVRGGNVIAVCERVAIYPRAPCRVEVDPSCINSV